MTLAPVIALQAEIASEDNKRWIANSLFYLGQEKTGSVEGDIRKLSTLVQG